MRTGARVESVLEAEINHGKDFAAVKETQEGVIYS